MQIATLINKSFIGKFKVNNRHVEPCLNQIRGRVMVFIIVVPSDLSLPPLPLPHYVRVWMFPII